MRRSRQMPLRLLALAIAAGLPVIAMAAADAVITPGSGTLTKCRDWLVYLQCSTYHHIAIPERIAVGDAVSVIYGSNPKEYVFHVKKISRHGRDCTLLSTLGGSGDQAEKLEITPCQPAPE